MSAAARSASGTQKSTGLSEDPAGPAGLAADEAPFGGVPELSVLERRYRRLLRLLPKGYREVRAEEMVTTFLEMRRADDPENFDIALNHGAPSWAERRSIAALALRLRLANPAAPVGHRIRVAALSRAMFAFLTVACALSILSLVSRIVAGFWPLTSVDEAWSMAQRLQAPQAIGLWPAAVAWVFVLWIPTLPLALCGGRKALATAATLAGIATVLDVASLTAEFGLARLFGDVAIALLYLVVTVLLAALATVDATVTVTHRRTWLIAAAAATGGLAAIQTAGIIAFDRGQLDQGWTSAGWLRPVGWAIVDEPGLWCWAVIAAAVIVKLLLARHSIVRPDQALALGYFAAAILAVRIATGIPLIFTLVAAARADQVHVVDYAAAITAICVHALLVALIARAALAATRRRAPGGRDADLREV